MMAVTNSENYAYRYIVELYNAGDSLNLNREITNFKAIYPESVYLPYIKFIEGNLAMEANAYSQAIDIYKALLEINLNQNVRSEIMLNYAYCLTQLQQYDSALQLLQRLETETGNPVYLEQANSLRGDIYFQLGQYYSAEKAYQRAVKAFPDNETLRFSLFSTYLALEKENQALELLKTQSPKDTYFLNYIQLWLEYLLENERYDDFDSFVNSYKLEEIAFVPEIVDIRIRRSLRTADFDQISHLLQGLNIDSPQFNYYRALVLIREGKEQQADSLLAVLVNSVQPEIAIPAYLERVKLLFKRNQQSAIEQLQTYLKQTPNELMKAELFYTLGYFYFQQENYTEAIRQLGQARNYETSRELNSRIDFLIAEAFYSTGNSILAKDAFNRYLNRYPTGSKRDKAFFYLGYLSFQEKDYPEAKNNFQELINLYPESLYCNEATYYLAEMDFYLANYNLALKKYLYLYSKNPENEVVALRLAQIYYYLGDYDQSESFLQDLVPNYDICLLKGNIMLARKNYTAALDQFLLAEGFAPDNVRKIEAQSYRALTLYQMKRFKDASALYLKLSKAKESPDTYLFLAAKSAYAARDYHLALELYNDFIEKYPESSHFLEALTDIANTYYNMGNYERAVNDWINILTRFRNTTKFTENQLAIIHDALIGLELALKRVDNKDKLLNELLVLPDTFFSEYIKFELNYILVKVYADELKWADLIATAEKIRTEFPAQKYEDIELLMATGLIELNKYAEADTLLSDLYTQSKNNEALLKWAELEFITGNYDSALEKYLLAYKNKPDDTIWVKLLECSEADNYKEFDKLWSLGS
ncbi:MAG TPA: tetratricopeptide repeat protein, partial [Candidatus Cloacimonas sp.]|nr:tetratricopeptide repeat protein [Candidatus Cloacimonas sp.]